MARQYIALLESRLEAMEKKEAHWLEVECAAIEVAEAARKIVSELKGNN